MHSVHVFDRIFLLSSPCIAQLLSLLWWQIRCITERYSTWFNLVIEDRLLAKADVRYYHGKLNGMLIELQSDLQYSDGCYDVDWEARQKQTL